MNREMSRKATMEYVGAKRRAYTKLKTTAARGAALDEFCAAPHLRNLEKSSILRRGKSAAHHCPEYPMG